MERLKEALNADGIRAFEAHAGHNRVRRSRAAERTADDENEDASK